MSRKDFEHIANILHTARIKMDDERDIKTVDSIIVKFSNELSCSYSKFDKKKFLYAAGWRGLTC